MKWRALRANEVKSLGSVPKRDGGQNILYQISAPQTVPASHDFFLLLCPKMELNARTWRDSKVLWFPNTDLCQGHWDHWRAGLPECSPVKILIQRADPDGWALRVFTSSPGDSCTQPIPPSPIHTPSFYRWGTNDRRGTSTILRSHC